MRADARQRRTALGLGPITGEMLHHSLNAFTNSQIAANLKHRARPCRKPCLMFHQASSPLDAGVILCRPFEKLFIRLSQNLDLPRSQALANSRPHSMTDPATTALCFARTSRRAKASRSARSRLVVKGGVVGIQ